MRNIAWIAVTAAITFCASWGYFVLSQPHGDGRLFLILTACGFASLTFRPPQVAALERDPEVRWGAFLGGGLGALGAFAVWLTQN
jgi:hypothetical protein